MTKYEETEKTDPPSCLDSAYERKAILDGSITSGRVFPENEKYLPTNAGVKHDNGKIRYELVPPEALAGLARVLTFGAKKYGDRNFEKGIKYSRVFGAALRHLWAWWGGEEKDPETGECHLHHAVACVVMLQTYYCRDMKGFDDRPAL